MSVTTKSMVTRALGAGKPVEAEDLAAINRFAHVALTAEQVYVRTYLIAHNGIDRDRERFSEDVLEDFARTLPASGLFVDGHPSWSKNGPGEGLWFKAWTEETTRERFKELTGEDIQLPPDQSASPKVLFGKSYLLKLDSNEDTLKKIDAGIYRFVSIGFNAPRSSVTDAMGNHIYGEYRPTGEALETSLVWRGAQPGASALKGAKGGPERPDDDGTKGESLMFEKQLAVLGARFGRNFKAETLADDITALFGEKETRIKELEGKMPGLESAAADGLAFRKGLVETAIKSGVLLGEIKTDEASQKAEETFLMTVPIDRLKAMAGKAEAAARTKFPDKFEIPSQDQADRDRKDAESAAASGSAGAGKDSLSEEAKKRAEAAKGK